MPTVHYFLSQLSDERWQDMFLSAGNIFFCFTLIPMLRHPVRPPLLTCVPTGLALLAGGLVFATLHLWLTALTQTITGLQWLALVFKSSPGPKADVNEADQDSAAASAQPITGLQWLALVFRRPSAAKADIGEPDQASAYEVVP